MTNVVTIVARVIVCIKLKTTFLGYHTPLVKVKAIIGLMDVVHIINAPVNAIKIKAINYFIDNPEY